MESVQFDSTGTMLLTQAIDGVARLWSAPGLEQIGSDLPGVASYPGAAIFAGRGASTTAIQIYSHGQAFVYPVSLAAWERQACFVAGRNFTSAEWAQYLGNRSYQNVCPDDSSGP